MWADGESVGDNLEEKSTRDCDRPSAALAVRSGVEWTALDTVDGSGAIVANGALNGTP
jgi:hypothetical protein